jgi:hypothetical protein
MNKLDLGGSTYMVLIEGEFAGWFNIPTGSQETFLLRSALASNPTIIDMEDMSIDIDDLPTPGQGYIWDGLEFDEGIYKPLNLLPKQGTKYYYDKLQDELDNNPDGDFASYMNGIEIDIHDLWEAMEGMGEAERKLIGKQVDHQLKAIAEELEKRSKGRGLIPSEMKDYIDSLFEVTEPVLDWKAYLRRFSNTSNKIITKNL